MQIARRAIVQKRTEKVPVEAWQHWLKLCSGAKNGAKTVAIVFPVQRIPLFKSAERLDSDREFNGANRTDTNSGSEEKKALWQVSSANLLEHKTKFHSFPAGHTTTTTQQKLVQAERNWMGVRPSFGQDKQTTEGGNEVK